MNTAILAQPYSVYRIRGEHTSRPIGFPSTVRTADDFDEAKRAEA